MAAVCAPSRRVSLPGCALNEEQKTKIYKQLAKEFATGTLKGTFKENFVKRQRDAVTARSLRKKDSETVATLQSIREKGLHALPDQDDAPRLASQM